MPEKLPPNIEQAYREELRGYVARLALATDDQAASLEARIATLNGLLGEANGVPKRRGRPPREARPDGDTETREA